MGGYSSEATALWHVPLIFTRFWAPVSEWENSPSPFVPFCHGWLHCQTFHSYLKAKHHFSRRWLANSHYLWCRKIPTSLPSLTTFKEILKWSSPYNQSDFLFTPLLWKISLTWGLKEKGENTYIRRRKCKEKANLPEMKKISILPL